MSDLSSQFTREDIETLIESVGDWEMLGNQEYHVAQMIKNAPMPPEDHEAHEAMTQIKEHFKKRERDLKRSREVRQERAVFLKAKLMLVRKDLGINALFDMTVNTDPNSPMPEKREDDEDNEAPPKKASPQKVMIRKKIPVQAGEEGKRLQLAEFFIKDLGVWDHYQKFLSEKANEAKEVKDEAEVKPEDGCESGENKPE
jgi:hypothetical protein